MLGEFHLFYPLLLDTIMRGGLVEMNQRTGVNVRVAPGAVGFNVNMTEGRLPLCGVRRTFPRTAAAETAWYLSGSNDVRWLQERRVHIWDKFVELNGYTIANSYGIRWQSHFGRDQIADAIRTLRNNPSDRQIVIGTWDPGCDGLGREAKNVPCPAMFTLNVIGGLLYSTMLLRSSDVFVGLPYDVMGHAFLCSAIASSLGRPMGTLTFTLAHAHIYEKHWSMATEASEQVPVDTEYLLDPSWNVELIKEQPDRYIAEMGWQAQDQQWPLFNPKPELVV